MKPISLREAGERFVQGHPGTWMAIVVGMMALLALVVVLIVELVTWLRESVSEPQDVTDKQQNPVVLSGPRLLQPLPAVVAAAPTPAQRDVSGTDPGPVARFPGLSRSHWHRDGREITVRYEGAADFDAVLTHYVDGFAALGYTQEILDSGATGGVKHGYMLGSDKVRFALSKKPKGGIKVSIITFIP